MTLKEIWKEFCDKVKDATGNCWESIKTVSKSTLDLLKQTVIDFVTGVFLWLEDLFIGVVSVIYELLKVIWAAFVAALKSTLGLIYEMIVEWIKKW